MEKTSKTKYPRTVPTPHVPLSYIDTVERDNPGSDCNVVGQHEASVRTWSLLRSSLGEVKSRYLRVSGWKVPMELG